MNPGVSKVHRELLCICFANKTHSIESSQELLTFSFVLHGTDRIQFNRLGKFIQIEVKALFNGLFNVNLLQQKSLNLICNFIDISHFPWRFSG